VPTRRQVERLAKKEILRCPFVLASRIGFANECIDTSRSFSSIIQLHLHLTPWRKAEALRFLDCYDQTTKGESVPERLRKDLQGSSANAAVVKSPLLLSLLLWLAIRDADVLLNAQNPSSVFAWFVDMWANREIERHGVLDTGDEETEIGRFVKSWTVGAWLIYESRHRQRFLTERAFLTNLRNVAGDEGDETEYPILKSLLTLSGYPRRVTGMLHEQFLEYLVARAFTESCTGVDGLYQRYLELPINYAVNQFVKAIWADADEHTLGRTLTRLKQAFVSSLEEADDEAVHVRANSVYYISRVPLLNRAKRTLSDILRDATELFSRNGVLWGLVRLGDRRRERDLYNSLTSDAEADALNRTLHLGYFRDVNIGGDLLPSRKLADIDWGRTLAGMMSHIESTEERFVNTRRIDIYTIRSLIRSQRTRSLFTEGHLQSIRESVEALGASEGVESDYMEEIREELHLLEKDVLGSKDA